MMAITGAEIDGRPDPSLSSPQGYLAGGEAKTVPPNVSLRRIRCK